MLIMLLTVAGFSVDLGNWWLQSTRVQTAADSGAHAGAVFLPGNVAQAKLTARTETARNGFNDGILAGTPNAAVTVTQLSNPYQLKVVVKTTVKNYFLSLIGMKTQTIRRDAVGEFEVPIAMGSPENKIGDDPEAGDLDSQFWINIAGPNATKNSGDRYQAKNCSSGFANCSGTANPGINNDDYSFDGYFFNLKVHSVDPGKDLVVQVFDGAMSYVGDHCEKGKFPSAAQLTTLSARYPDATTRYAGGDGDWCTGDQDIGGRTTNTVFLVREPDDTPWSDTDNPIVSTTKCHPEVMPSYDASVNNSIYNWLTPWIGSYAAA